MREQRIEGYWHNPNLDKTSIYPMPIPDVLTQDEADEIYDLILHKEKDAKILHYKGLSHSRITNEYLGCKEFITNQWRWPGDFAKHYVKDHRVKPSDDFLKYIGYYKK